jgi:hypothetical protein
MRLEVARRKSHILAAQAFQASEHKSRSFRPSNDDEVLGIPRSESWLGTSSDLGVPMMFRKNWHRCEG